MRPAIPITTNAPDQMPLFMQLYTSPDYRSPLDPNSYVQTDKKIYAEARNHAAAWLFSVSVTWIYCTFLTPVSPRFLCLLQISMNPYGVIDLTIEVMRCFVSSKDSCSAVRDLPFMAEACSPNSCPNSVRLSFSLDQLQELTSTIWDLECSVKLCSTQVSADWVAFTPLLRSYNHWCIFMSFFMVIVTQ